MSEPDDKADLRARARTRREALPADGVAEASARLARCLGARIPHGASVAAYAGCRGEPDPAPELASLRPDLTFAWPVAHPKSRAMTLRVPDGPLALSRYGIPEPRDGHILPPDAVDLVLVPGLLFTPFGDRLGFGGGYYDRFLGALAKEVTRIGIGYTWQVIDRLPIEKHDIRLTHLALDDGRQAVLSRAGATTEQTDD